MKKGQTGLALVILGVITIIAIIGLVLLFTKASTTGEYVSPFHTKAYVGQTGGMSYDKAHFVILGGGVEHISQCRIYWGSKRVDKQIMSDKQITCYVVQDQSQREQLIRKYDIINYPGRLPSDVLCYLNDLGYQDLSWYNPADKICIPTRHQDIFPN